MSRQSAKIVAVGATPAEAEARPRGAPAKALDLVYLARQSLGDKKLETELLALFDRQSAQVVERLSQLRPGADPSWPRDLAHTLIGSARAVGAFGVAAAAEAYEALTVTGAPAPEIETAFQILSEEVEMTRVSISRLLG